MQPRTRDFLAAGLLAIVLIALVAMIFIAGLPKAA